MKMMRRKRKEEGQTQSYFKLFEHQSRFDTPCNSQCNNASRNRFYINLKIYSFLLGYFSMTSLKIELLKAEKMGNP